MPSADQLPEGTDAIIEGAGVSDDNTGEDFPTGRTAGASAEPEISAIKSEAEAGKAALFDRFDDLRGQATDRARDFAQAGKDRSVPSSPSRRIVRLKSPRSKQG